jgi:Zn-dependent protease
LRRRGSALVAAAGPAANLVIALVGAAALRLAGADGSASAWASAAWLFVLMNLCIGVFNLIPLFPMDGGRLVASCLPARAFDWLTRHEGRATLAALVAAVAVPWGLSLLGVSHGPFDFLSDAYQSLVDAVTGTSGDAWYKAMTELVGRI